MRLENFSGYWASDFSQLMLVEDAYGPSVCWRSKKRCCSRPNGWPCILIISAL